MPALRMSRFRYAITNRSHVQVSEVHSQSTWSQRGITQADPLSVVEETGLEMAELVAVVAVTDRVLSLISCGFLEFTYFLCSHICRQFYQGSV